MDMSLKQQFLERWGKYTGRANLPITFYYTDQAGQGGSAAPASPSSCVICQLQTVRRGKSLCLSLETVRCSGGKRYLGFKSTLRPNFEYFLSCGIPGEMEGERYKQSPELVAEQMKHQPAFQAPGRYIVFKRWDKLDESDEPAVVIFFAPPDLLSGLFTLAGFDEAAPEAVIAPFGSGCASIVQYPYFEGLSPHPRAVLGLFDVSARPCVPAGVLTFAVPWPKFVRMVANMDESFLITASWAKVQARLR
jgi:uncharacterized protein (DUF169 family)